MTASISYNSVNLFGEWKFKFNQDMCVICRNMLTEHSEFSIAKKQFDPVIEGNCGHQFHKSCVNKWSSEYNNKCAVCCKQWIVDNEENENVEKENDDESDSMSFISQFDNNSINSDEQSDDELNDE